MTPSPKGGCAAVRVLIRQSVAPLFPLHLPPDQSDAGAQIATGNPAELDELGYCFAFVSGNARGNWLEQEDLSA